MRLIEIDLVVLSQGASLWYTNKQGRPTTISMFLDEPYAQETRALEIPPGYGQLSGLSRHRVSEVLPDTLK